MIILLVGSNCSFIDLVQHLYVSISFVIQYCCPRLLVYVYHSSFYHSFIIHLIPCITRLKLALNLSVNFTEFIIFETHSKLALNFTDFFKFTEFTDISVTFTAYYNLAPRDFNISIDDFTYL